MIDLIRKNKKNLYSDENDFVQPNFIMTSHDVKEIIDQAVARLPEIQRNVLMLRDYEGYSYKEIGGIVGLNESQVRVYIFRARKKLKEYIVKLENVI
jgi:RNA polymerase sigma-70 factor (ECF subfamily)